MRHSLIRIVAASLVCLIHHLAVPWAREGEGNNRVTAMEQSRPSEVSDAKFAELSEEFIQETLVASPSVASQV
ncbi:MAG TPA: hypothetical protein VF749_12655, partial [Candidatus Acidoferrum sp.]